MKNRKHTPVLNRPGSALLLVLVVTVLLSVIGILFVMVTRLRDITSSNVADSRDLETGVEAVVGQIQKTLKEDALTAIDGNELYDSAASDAWLASLEPTWLNDNGTPNDPTDDWYQWGQITKFPGVTSKWDLILRDGKKTPWILPQFGGIVDDYQAFTVTTAGKTVPMSSAQVEGLPADADGDGVADSMWMKLPSLSSSRGQPVFAAVRIIDNCAMLNLNTAFGFYQRNADTRSWYSKPWFKNLAEMMGNTDPYNSDGFGANFGRYLSEVNYGPFLRSYDAANGGRVERIQLARDTEARQTPNAYNSEPNDYHNKFIMNIDDPIDPNVRLFQKFDISDELEMRNRYMLTSKTISRIERRDTREEQDQGLLPRFLQGLFGEAYDGIGYQTFDFEQGRPATESIDSWSQYFGVRVESVPRDVGNFGSWKVKMNPAIFDNNPYDSTNSNGAKYLYDRRHLCTFYSFDRNLRSGKYVLIDAAMKTPAIQGLTEDQQKAVDAIFRPADNRPINLRWITDPANSGNITQNTVEARRNILHLLYAFKEYYFAEEIKIGFDPNMIPTYLSNSAKKSAQIVANMIDYLDDNTSAVSGPFGGTAYGSQINANPTYINKSIVDTMLAEVSGSVITPAWASYSSIDFGLTASDVLYGYEQQPFIADLYVRVDDSGAADRFAIELVNPYMDNIDLSGWSVVIERSDGNSIDQFIMPAGTVIPAASAVSVGRMVVRSNTDIVCDGMIINAPGFGLIIKNPTAHRLGLRRIDPVAGALAADRIVLGPVKLLLTDTPGDGLPTHHIFKKEDTAWKFCNADPNLLNYQSVVPAAPGDFPAELTLGLSNAGVTTTARAYSLPVANTLQSVYTLGDFQRILFVGNQKTGTDPDTITEIIANSTSEADIRFDPISDANMMGYFCTLNRDKEGNLPGRININTAPVHVIAAAISPQLVMNALNDPDNALTIAQQIVSNRPYKTLSDLAKLPVMQKYADPNSPANPGDDIRGDFEERDWIFNRLANIFTVRSDTFTAYILVRLGTDGPQRRMIAVFDRSNVWSDTDKPKLVALHPVPDPR